MLPELKFNKEMFRALSEGRKTVTRRKDPKDICGGLYVTAVCTETGEMTMIKCTDKYSQRVSEMTETDAKKEGFGNLEGFRNEIEKIYGREYLEKDPIMWVYEFILIGKTVPCTVRDNEP